MQERPSNREIDKRIKEAKRTLQENDVIFANPCKAMGEINALNLRDTEELRPLVIDLLEEINLQDYAGSCPPQRSYESSISDCELWAFSWDSLRLGKRMYLKFAVKDSRFFLVSIHKSKKI